ncbi:MAG: PocR ligand-binding domain-containing protein [bacterium]
MARADSQAPEEGLQLKDLLGQDRIGRLLTGFSGATGLETRLISFPDQELLFSTGLRDICSRFHQAAQRSAPLCEKSHGLLVEILQDPHQSQIMTCEMGLASAATPVHIAGRCVGNLLAGQVFLSEPDPEQIRQQARTYGYAEEAYLAAAARVPVFTERQLEKTMLFLGDLAELIGELGLRRLQDAQNIKNTLAKHSRAEQALRYSEERLVETSTLFETLFDTIPDVLGLQDNQHTILRYNEAGYRFLGLTPEEAIGKKCYSLIGRTSQCTACATTEACRTKRLAQLERYIPELDIWLDIRVYPILNVAGEITHIVEHLRDITPQKMAEEQRRNLEEQVRHAQKLESLGVLAGGIAHDFNNLLMAIIGNTDLALLETPSGSISREYLQEISTASRHAAELCRQMLAYSGKGNFVIESIDLSAFVTEMAYMLDVSTSKQISLQRHLAADLPLISADPTQIRQVIMNLITNASEAIGDQPGVISITTGVCEVDREYLASAYLDEDLPEGTYLTLTVADTGCGMTTEVQDRLFDPFFSTKFTGRGLGMAAVLGILRGHGGAIKIDSEPDRGTTFTLLLPASTESAATVSEAPNRSRKSIGQFSGTVLVVDDESYIRTLSKRMLEKLGFSVLTATDGLDALAVFRDRPEDISCVILDLTMPNLGGVETFQKLRQSRPDIKVLLTSGYTEQEATMRFVDKGLSGFIQKPYQIDTLLGKLREILG